MIDWPSMELPPINLWNVPPLNNGHVAQTVEHSIEDPGVGGSTPSVSTKRKNVMQVETDNMVLFWQNDSVFSNWYQPAKIMFSDIEFKNSEALFMYLKAKCFKDEVAMAKVVENQDPKEVKAIGRTIKNYDDDEWSAMRFSQMTIACYLKFKQNPELGQALVATGDKTLVEASPYDTIWGIGLRPDDPRALDESNWYGQNLLGKALVTVRNSLRDNLPAMVAG